MAHDHSITRCLAAMILVTSVGAFDASAYASDVGGKLGPSEEPRASRLEAGAVHVLSSAKCAQVREQSFHDANGRSKLVRIELESDEAETIDIDTANNAIRAFGLSFAPTMSETGTPNGLVLSDANDTAVLVGNGNGLVPATAEDARTMNRISRRLNAANGLNRMRKVQETLKCVLAANAQSGRGAHTLDVFNCVMDVVALVLDWVGVVVACGAPVIDVFACGWAITWATADTIHEVQSIANDCP